MASKAKPIDIRPTAGGKARKVPRQALGSGASSDGESPPSGPDEDDHGCFQVPVPIKKKICPETQRPDLDVAIKTVVEDKLIIRSSQLATHVLVMGTPNMMLAPVQCPYDGTGCDSFYAHAPQLLKEHLESKHQLFNVQLNFVCPCPADCNIINGRPRECEVVEYDPLNGIMDQHLITQHKEYYEKMATALYHRAGDEEDEEEEDIIYEDPEYNVSKEDKEYIKYLNFGKKFPDWTKKPDEPFPSQRIAQKVTIQGVMKDKKVNYYRCNIHPCDGKLFGYFDMGKHLQNGHPGVLGGQTQWYERCPVQGCPTTMHWCEQKMGLHIQAIHPELLGKPVHFVQKALDELAKLKGQIQEVCIGQAIADTAEPGDESDGTKVHLLYEYICPAVGCNKRFEERDFAQWHLIVHHEKQWNVGGND